MRFLLLSKQLQRTGRRRNPQRLHHTLTRLTWSLSLAVLGLFTSVVVLAEHVHGLDAEQKAEHAALEALFMPGEATTVAIRSGLWSRSATWSNGIPSADSRVLIPNGVVVSFDQASTPRVRDVAVQGELNFVRGKSLSLSVETIYVYGTGRFIVGSKAQPFDQNSFLRVVFLDNGEINTADDPTRLSRGLVSHGEVRIFGERKTAFLELARNARKGDTSVKLRRAPINWRPGDRLLLTGTTLASHVESFDEVRTISRVDEDVVSFTTALEHEHAVPGSPFSTYAGNLSRNVVFTSESDETSRRGHVMLMHTKKVDVRNASFLKLGRTNKALEVSQSTDNVPGRYSLHFHRMGSAPEGTPAIAVGNVAEDSPGFCFVHHGSYAIYQDNIGYRCFGTSFIAESGDETGVWRHNLAVRSIGRSGSAGKPKASKGTFNIGNGGNGFYFQGRLVGSIDNVAASMPGAGFLYFHRATSNSKDNDYRWLEHPLTGRFLASESARSEEWEKTLNIDSPSIQSFIGNVAIASSTGLEVIKDKPQQGHDNRSILEDFFGYELQVGVHLNYTGYYTLRNFHLVSTAADEDQKGSNKTWDSSGIQITQRHVDIVVADSSAAGFYEAVKVEAVESHRGIPDSVLIYGLDATGSKHRITRGEGVTVQQVQERSLSSIRKEVIPKLSIGSDADLSVSGVGGNEYVWFDGTKQDSTGSTVYGLIPKSTGQLQMLFGMSGRQWLASEGFYTASDGSKVALLPEIIVDRFSGVRMLQQIPVDIRDDSILEGVPYRGELPTGSSERDAFGRLQVNSLPYAAYDFGFTTQGEPLVLPLLSNDTDLEGDAFKLAKVEASNHGLVEIIDEVAGLVRYTPNVGFEGLDNFYYEVADLEDSTRATRSRVDVFVGFDLGQMVPNVAVESSKPKPPVLRVD
ncbi:MAG: G8 domain-containing protein [Pseudomonadota bacterium]